MVRPMKNATPFPRPEAPRAATVSVLTQPARAIFDPSPVMAIYSDTAEHHAEEIICRALEDLAYRINAVMDLHRASQLDPLHQAATQLADRADRIGMVELAKAARHVAACAALGDPIALEAVMARLERAFDLGLMQVWDARESG